MIRLGIAGVGFIAEEYIKLITNGSIQGAEVKALSSRNYAHMEEIRNKYRLDAELFTDYEEMLGSGKIDAVMICTPHYFHPGMAIKAIRQGIHAMIEKPVGIFPEELKALTECLDNHPDVKAGVLYCRRTNPIYQQIKEFLDSGALGQLKRVTWIITNASVYRTQAYYNTASWRGTYTGEGGGLLLNQVSHHIDMLIWLLGLPEAIQANCYTARERQIEVENEVSITMEYPGHGIGQFISSTREFPGTNRLEISGSKAQLILENEKDLTIRKLAVEETEFNRTSNVAYAFIPYEEEIHNFEPYENTKIQARIVNNFISAVTDGTPITCPVEDAILAQQFIIGAYLSSWQEKKLTLPADGAAFTAELKKRF